MCVHITHNQLSAGGVAGHKQAMSNHPVPYANYLRDQWAGAIAQRLETDPTVNNQTLQALIIRDPGNAHCYRTAIAANSVNLFRQRYALELMKRAAEVIVQEKLDWRCPPVPIVHAPNWGFHSPNNFTHWGGYGQTHVGQQICENYQQRTNDNVSLSEISQPQNCVSSVKSLTDTPGVEPHHAQQQQMQIDWHKPADKPSLMQEIDSVEGKEAEGWKEAEIRAFIKGNRKFATKRSIPLAARLVLEEAYIKKQYANAKERSRLADETKLTPKQVMIWFANERYRTKCRIAKLAEAQRMHK